MMVRAGPGVAMAAEFDMKDGGAVESGDPSSALASPRHYLGHRLRTLRRAKGLSARELAGRAHVDCELISRIERAEPTDGSAGVVRACDRALGAAGELIDLHTMITRAHAAASRSATQNPHPDLGRPAESDYGAAPAPRQLPADVRGFVNRQAELQRLDAVLSAGDEAGSTASCVCVVAGTAGVGKTSLAIHWAHRAVDRFPDGQLYANLHGYDPAQPVPAAQALERFLRALNMPADAVPQDADARAAAYRSLLAGRRILIVLDNAATVGQVRPLLPGTAGCLVLVTSRSRLSGLVARDGAHRVTLDVLPEPDAVALLHHVTDGYRGGDDEQEIAELARLCARLPLALRVAGERAASRPRMPLRELIDDLHDECALWDVLTTGDNEETDTVRTVLAWSYRALPEQAARLFRLLGLHPGPDFSTPIAAAVLGVAIGRARHLLDVLTGVHMLERIAHDRYQFHDLLRAYALDMLHREEDPDVERAALERVAQWYLYSADNAVAASMFPQRRFPLDPPPEGIAAATFTDHAAVVRWFDAERANLLAAARAAAAGGLHRLTWQLAGVLYGIYNLRHPFDDWFTATGLGLQAAREDGDRFGQAHMLYSLGKAQAQSNQLDRAIVSLQEALSIQRAIGDRLGQALTLSGAALGHRRLHRLAEALACAEQARALGQELGDHDTVSCALHNLGDIFGDLGQYSKAAAFMQQAVTISRALGDRLAESEDLSCLSWLQAGSGLLDEADASAQHALRIATETDDRVVTAFCVARLGDILNARGEFAQALTTLERAAAMERELGHRDREAYALNIAGETCLRLGRTGEAIGLHRRAAAVFEQFGDHWRLAWALDNLATALCQADALGEAQERWNQALALLTGFDDPSSDRTRSRITAALEKNTTP